MQRTFYDQSWKSFFIFNTEESICCYYKTLCVFLLNYKFNQFYERHQSIKYLSDHSRCVSHRLQYSELFSGMNLQIFFFFF